MTSYSDDFFAQTYHQGHAAAERVVALLADFGFEPASVVDIGGGAGGWLVPFAEEGASVTLVDQLNQTIESHLDERISYLPIDLESADGLDRIPRSDLAICVEVLEHLSPQAANRVIGRLSECFNTIIFSAAWNGQGGDHHINERPMGAWLNEWISRGFVVADVVRSTMWNLPRYYQTNLVLCSRDPELISRLIRQAGFLSDIGVPDLRRPHEKGFGSVLRRLPPSFVTSLAQISHRFRPRPQP